MKYAGPQYIMANVSNNCFLDVLRYWIHDDSIQGQPCLTQNGVLENRNNVFIADVCHNPPPMKSQNVQVKTIDGFQRIYCFGVNITIRGELLACPKFAFEIPLVETYILNNVTHKGRKISRSIDAIDVQINRDICRQLKMDEKSIYGVNLTTLNTGFKKLDDLVSKLKPLNITKNDISAILGSPLDVVTIFISGVWETFKNLTQIALVVILVVLLVASAPLIEFVFWIVKLMYRAIKTNSARFRLVSNQKGDRLSVPTSTYVKFSEL